MSAPTVSEIEAARRADRADNAFARLMSAGEDGQPADAGFVERLTRRAEWSFRVRQHIRETLCGGCGYGGEIYASCSSRGDAELFDGAPMCRHADRAAVERREAEHTSERLQRLIVAGCGDADCRRLVPPARAGAPPLPVLTRCPEDLRLTALRGPQESTRAAAAFSDDRGLLTLVLRGGNGVGKSLAAALVVAADSGSSCWLAAEQYSSFAGVAEFGPRARRCDLLVVDELGTDREGPPGGGCGTAEISELILARRNSGRRIVLTTNLTQTQLGRYGKRFLDRLEARSLIVDCGEFSLRRYL